MITLNEQTESVFFWDLSIESRAIYIEAKRFNDKGDVLVIRRAIKTIDGSWLPQEFLEHLYRDNADHSWEAIVDFTKGIKEKNKVYVELDPDEEE